jgi:cytochrome c biogenesis protein CcmG, thiol:disulfide interchange protein DsbE
MMTTRWMIAAACAVGVGVLTASALLGPTSPGAVEEANGSDPARVPGTCLTKQANLDFTVKDMNGARVRLADYKGKVLLINFWATWCAPCKVELPGLIELQDAYKDRGLMVLGISEDDPPEALRTFATEWKINYPMLVGLGEDKLFDAYGPLVGLPTSVIVGRDGAECGRHVGAATKEEFEREIKALL